MNRSLLTLLLAVICVVVSLAGIAQADDRPNIVWIFVEDTNAWMGCYGDELAATPNIDALAERGVRFERAYMPAGVCSATRSGMAYGAMQTTFGVHNHRSSRRGDRRICVTGPCDLAAQNAQQQHDNQCDEDNRTGASVIVCLCICHR